MKLPYAERINYWKTGGSAPGDWLEKARHEIGDAGGKVLAIAEGMDATTGREAYMIGFELQGDRFKIIWPVLPTRSGSRDSLKAARRQAATMLYHHVKAACMDARVRGGRIAFFSALLLPDGRTASQVATPELALDLSQILNLPALPSGE